MKRTILTSMLLLPFLIFGQGGWTKITDSPITAVNAPGTYKGAAWADINNDGNVDLFTMPNSMFLNNGNGTFTQLNGLNINPNPLQTPGGCSWGDINNDGFIDFITAQNPSEIYINNGNNTFQNISASIPQFNSYASWGAALADANNDNKLDLLYAQAYGFHGAATPLPCKYFLQNSDAFTFAPITGYTFTDETKPYTVPYFYDYDQDGDMDIFIASGPGGLPGPDFCYKNMKKETGNDILQPMTSEPWTTQLQDGQCYNFVDYDNDGDLDMCLTNYGGAASRFYKNNNGTYEAVTTPFTTQTPRLANDWGDFDNDGDLDLIIARDSASLLYYQNNGDGTFSHIAPSITVNAGSSAIINSDYDNDGDLDVFVNGAVSSLWRNDAVAGSRKWVNYTLKGTVSNTSAIGAFVKIKATINGVPVWQTRHVTAQNSFQSQNDLRVHFGLNDATTIDSLLIYWPSGLKEYYLNKNADQFETLVEGNGTALALNKNIRLKNITLFPNPANDYVTISIDDKSFKKLDLKIADLSGKIIYSNTLLNKESKIPVKELKGGTYLFIMNYKEEYFTGKVIVN